MKDGHSVKVLDRGYVKLIESWGSDERIVESARMSTAKGVRGWGPLVTGMPCNPNGEYNGQPREVLPNFLADIWKQNGRPDYQNATNPYRDVREEPGDEKLLKYLWDKKHTTPFEMAGITIEVKAPIMVFREWHRHRTQCLSGDTMISCVSPRGTTYQRSIKSIFDLKHGGVIDTAPARHKNGTSRSGRPVTREARRKDAWRTRVLPNCQSRTLRVLDETNGTFTTAEMLDVWESGTKTVFLVETDGGHSVRASAEHPFFTQRGWVKVKELVPGDRIARMGKVAAQERPIPPSLRQGIAVWTSMMRSRLLHEDGDVCYLCGESFAANDLTLDHVVPVSQSLLTALDERNLRPACVRCHISKSSKEQPKRRKKSRRGIRWEKLSSVPREIGEEPTYDIEVVGPHHNYVANGLVVHNSYSEMSARYVPLPNDNYVPDAGTVHQRALAAVGSKNRQAAGITDKAPTMDDVLSWLADELLPAYERTQRAYEKGLALGIPKEIARLPVPVGRYSCMRASANLLNWTRFLTLRAAKDAQWEIREYSTALLAIVHARFPRTYEVASPSILLLNR